ncbi:MAG: nucleotidyl transferase AbiEii/AbiGii toxin family protein [Anaerolineales bacterium]|nr:nucleotidyl transferase AbiEii/AbiGii toxin family protein [Anaerolineales bacterium]
MIIGGIAVSLLGKPRLTADVDAVILLSIEEIPKIIKAASELGLQPRIAQVEAFARKNRILLVRHEESGIDVDISLGVLPFEIEMVERSNIVEIETHRLQLPTPEDLIILKAVAYRPKDLLDIKEIINNHPKIDRRRFESWVTQFSEALEIPEIWDDIKKNIRK